MKKLLTVFVTCAVLASAAFADNLVFAKFQGNKGGEIVLLKMGGQCPMGQMMMFARSRKNTDTIEGCWTTFKDGYIIVYYNNGDIRTYPLDVFTVMRD